MTKFYLILALVLMPTTLAHAEPTNTSSGYKKYEQYEKDINNPNITVLEMREKYPFPDLNEQIHTCCLESRSSEGLQTWYCHFRDVQINLKDSKACNLIINNWK